VLLGITRRLRAALLTPLFLCLAVAAQAAGQETQTSDINSGLVAYYPFNGNANDESGNGHDPSVTNATPAADRFGVPDRAYGFGGTDWIGVPNENSVFSLTNALTVCAWVYPARGDREYRSNPIVWKMAEDGTYQDAFYLSYGYLSNPTNGIERFFFGMETGQEEYRAISRPFSTSTWHHVCGTFDGQALRVFVDGEPVGTQSTGSGSPIAGSAGLRIGNNLNSDHSYKGVFAGSIDDVRIYNRALSAAEVAALHQMTAPHPFAVDNLSVVQRQGTKLVDIRYDVTAATSQTVTVSVLISNGASRVSATSLTGDVGPVTTGTGKHIVWDAGADWNRQHGTLHYTVQAVGADGQTVLVDTFEDGSYSNSPAWTQSDVGGAEYVTASVQSENAVGTQSLKLTVDSQANWAHDIFMKTPSVHPLGEVTYSFVMHNVDTIERGSHWWLEDDAGHWIVGMGATSWGTSDPSPLVQYIENGTFRLDRSHKLHDSGLHEFTIRFNPAGPTATYEVRNPSGMLLHGYTNVSVLASNITTCVLRAGAGQTAYKEYFFDKVSYSISAPHSSEASTQTYTDTRSASLPAGDQVAYVANDHTNSYVEIIDSDGKRVWQMTEPLVSASSPNWSPDGSRITYACNSTNGDSDVWVLVVNEGTAAPILATDEHEYLPMFSPDGTALLFARHAVGTDINPWIAGSGGEMPRALYSSVTEATSPRGWSPDSQTVLIESEKDRAGGWIDIWRMNRDGTGLTRLTAEGGQSGYATPSRVGDLWVYRHAPNYDRPATIKTMRIDGSAKTNVAVVGTALGHVYFSPDNTHIAFCSDSGGSGINGDLGVVNRHSGSVTWLDNGDCRLGHSGASYPSSPWSFDGSWIVYSAQTGGQWDLFKIRPDGTEKTRMTNTPNRDETHAVFRPDPFGCGLVAYYPFNGNANDESGNGNHAIATNATFGADRCGNAASACYFDGTSSYIDLGNLDQGTNAKTWVVWAKSDVVGTAYPKSSALLGNSPNTGNAGLTLRLHHAQGAHPNPREGRIQVFAGDGTYDAYARNMLDTAWHQYVAVYDGIRLNLFADGREVSQSTDFILASTPLNLEIGRDTYVDSRSWQGSIDEVRIYSRALSADAVASLYDLDAFPGMARIPGGEFVMGDNHSAGHVDELPVHTVQVSTFYMERYEVTKALWEEVYVWATNNSYAFDNAGSAAAADHPIHTISWHDMVKWCNARSEMAGLVPAYYTSSDLGSVYRTGTLVLNNDWVQWRSGGYRLPTEAEWEKAARGGLAEQYYPWPGTGGSHAEHLDGSKANYENSSDPYDNGTTPVGYYDGGQSPAGVDMANGYGLYDMAGNVYEQCWDWYKDNWYSQPGALADDPRGPENSSGHRHALRGGFWLGNAETLRCANRSVWGSDQSPYIGFRTVRGTGTDPRDLGTIAYYPFNGNANDESGNGNHAVLTNATLTADSRGRVDQAYEFDGDNDYIDIGIENLSAARTFSWWAKIDSTGTDDEPMLGVSAGRFATLGLRFSYSQAGGGWHPQMNDDGGGNDVLAHRSVDTMDWHHYTVVIGATGFRWYLDGELVDASSETNTLGSNIFTHYLGRSRYREGVYFDGKIDEYRIHDRPLSDTEVFQLYAAGVATHFVSPAGSSLAPYATWATAATNIQDALDAAGDGHTVVVTNGVYAAGGATVTHGPCRVAVTQAVRVVSVNGADATTIVGAGPMGAGAVRGVYLSDGAELIGFTVTNGNVQTSGDQDLTQKGGGIYGQSTSAMVSNCVIAGCAAWRGGGVFGGTVRDCVVRNNSATYEGAGTCESTVRNSLIVGNSATTYGGGVYGGRAESCTIVDNSAGVNGGGTKQTTVANSIVYHNTAASAANYHEVTLSYSCTTPLPSGNGNIADVPMLDGNYRLSPVSPCVDRGLDQAWMTNATDLAGNRRILRTAVDMGAYEESSLVAYLGFDGDANDKSGYGNDGTAHSSPGYAQGIAGQAIDLNGLNQYVRVGNSDSLNPDYLTLSAWVRLDTLPSSFAAVIQKYNDGSDDDITYQMMFRDTGDGEIRSTVRNAGGTAFGSGFAANVRAGVWTHLCLTYGASSMQTYINGVPSELVAVSGTVKPSAYDVSIGRGKPLAGRWIDGSIDELRVYNSALSSNEVSRLYQDSWTATPMPTARRGGDAVGHDGRIWYVGGKGPGNSYVADVMAYNPASGAWDTSPAPITTPRTGLGMTEVDGVLFTCGGYSQSDPHVTTVEAYDVAGDAWTTETPMLNRCASLPGSVVSHGGKVFVIGGNYYSADRDTAQIFDTVQETWSESSSMGYGARGVAAAAVNGLVYMIGGADMAPGAGPHDVFATVQAYNPAADTWTPKDALPQPRMNAEAVVIDGMIWCVGGQSVPDGPVVREILRYVPAVNRWEDTGIALSDRQARAGMAAVAHGRFIYLLGGTDPDSGEPTDRVDVIDTEGGRRLTDVIVIGGLNVPEGSNATYTCMASYSDGTSRNVSTQATWRLPNGAPAGTVLSNGLLTAGEVVSNTVITVSADYTFGGDTETDSVDVTILDRPTADFTAAPTSGAKPLSVTFADHSTGDIDTWEWDFDDDGRVDAINPSAPIRHVYTNDGFYSVRLVVTGRGGSDTMTRTNYVSVGPGGNRRPVVRVPEDGRQIFISSLGKKAALDASESYDPDGDTIYFSWREAPTNPRRGLVPIGSHALSRLHLFFPTSGRYTFYVRVSDGEFVSADIETITVYVSGVSGRTTVAGTGGQGISDVRVSAYTNDLDAQLGINPVDVDIADSEGNIDLENVRTASPTNGQTYKIRVERPGFLTNYLDRTILPDPGPGTGDEDFSIGRGYTDVILGTVSDRDGGAALSGVTAHLEGHGFQSTFSGVFWFSNVRQGSWSLQLYKEGYQPEVRDINVGTNAPNLDFTLAPAMELGRLTGRVTLAGTGRAVPGATVALGAGRTEYTVATDARGGFAYADLPTGTYLLTVSKDGYETLRFLAVSVRPGETRLDVDLFLETDLTIMGRVVDDRNGRAIHLATAGVPADGGLLLNSDVTDHCGYFVVSGLAAGERTLRVTAPGYVPETRLYSLTGHEDAGAIRLRRSAFWQEPAAPQPGAPIAALAWSNYYANGLGEVVTPDGRPSHGTGLSYIWREFAGNPRHGLLPSGTSDPQPEIAGMDRPGIYMYELQVQSGGTLSPNTAVAGVFVPGIVGNVHASPSDGLEPKEQVAIGLYADYNDALTRRNAVRETLSGGDGSFELSARPGEYWLTADPEPGSGFEPYGPVAQRVNYSSTMQSVDINLWRREYIIEGMVTDEDTGDPLENVRVAVAPGIITESLRTSTGAGGGFRLSGVPGGGQTILLVKDGYASRSVAVQIPPPPGISLDMTMTANPSNLAATVSGMVVAEYLGVAFPVPHAEVILEGGLFRTFTDADGRYQLGDLPPGYHHGVIRCAGYETSYLGESPVFLLTAGDNPLPTKTLVFKGNGPVLRGVVLDENQQPVSGASVSIVAPALPGQPPARSAALASTTITTDAAGVFQLVNVPHGVRVLRVEPSGADAMDKAVEVVGNMELTLSLSIVPRDWVESHFPGGKWPGDAVDSDGDGIDNATEYVMDTAPTNGAVVFETLMILDAGKLNVIMTNTSSNRLYHVESCNDLLNPVWEPLSIDTVGTGDILEYTITGAADERFIRGRVRVPGE